MSIKNVFGKGFTLVEMLLVILAISILTGFVIINIQGSKNIGNDVRIVADMEIIKNGLEAYSSDNYNNVPILECTIGEEDCSEQLFDKLSPYLPSIPTSDDKVLYTYSSDGTSFIISAVSKEDPSAEPFYYFASSEIASTGWTGGETIWTCGASFTDIRDYNVYSTVEMGGNCWMAENLKYLPSVSPASDGSETDPYYYVYGYDGIDVAAAKGTDNYKELGVLYNWPAAVKNNICWWAETAPEPEDDHYVYAAIGLPTEEEIEELELGRACPSGWRLPTNNELIDLERSVCTIDCENQFQYDTSKNYAGNDESRTLRDGSFKAKITGVRYVSSFALSTVTGFWSSTPSPSVGNFAFRHQLNPGDTSPSIHYGHYYKKFGYSVRCVKE
jgi:uncharacterized protein (TIGR02145 family)/prepilin-type N-terminal cleavage/methylation domain-containing protein